jgi:glutamate racemase
VIGVLGTEATVRQPYVDDLARRFAADCTVLRHGSAGLVALAEAALGGTPPDPQAVRAELDGLLDQPQGSAIEVIVNACTHFPLLEDVLSAAAPGVRFIDGGPGIARRVAFLTDGQDWPDAPVAGRAVFTARSARTDALAPALARHGLMTIESL